MNCQHYYVYFSRHPFLPWLYRYISLFPIGSEAKAKNDTTHSKWRRPVKCVEASIPSLHVHCVVSRKQPYSALVLPLPPVVALAGLCHHLNSQSVAKAYFNTHSVG